MTAALTPALCTDGDDDRACRVGHHDGVREVTFSCFDAYDVNPIIISAVVNGGPVEHGQLVKLQLDGDDGQEVQTGEGTLSIGASSFALDLTCADSSGNEPSQQSLLRLLLVMNRATASASICAPPSVAGCRLGGCRPRGRERGQSGCCGADRDRRHMPKPTMRPPTTTRSPSPCRPAAAEDRLQPPPDDSQSSPPTDAASAGGNVGVAVAGGASVAVGSAGGGAPAVVGVGARVAVGVGKWRRAPTSSPPS